MMSSVHSLLKYLQDGTVVGTLNNTRVFNITAPASPKNGFVGLGTAEYGLADFDNLRIDTAEGGLRWMEKRIKDSSDKNLDSIAIDKSENLAKVHHAKNENSGTKLKEVEIVDTVKENVILEELDVMNDKNVEHLESETLYFKSLREIMENKQ